MSKKIIIIIFVGLFLISLMVLWSYNNVFYPSYMSMVSVCNPHGAEIINKSGLVIAGIFQMNLTTGIGEIKINPEFANKKTIKHEIVHSLQAEQNRFYSCEFPQAFYFNEIEAYSMSYLPDWIFFKIY